MDKIKPQRTFLENVSLYFEQAAACQLPFTHRARL